MNIARWRAFLTGLWAGCLVTIAGLVAPSLFAILDRASAGAVVARLFMAEAYLSLALSVAVALVERRSSVPAAEAGQGSRFSINLGLALGALFCTVLGYFALQPMMEQARLGVGPWSFATLHGVSGALYGLKVVLVGTLAWRSTAAAANR